MQIEEITSAALKVALKKASVRELHNLRFRFIQLYEKCFEGNAQQQVGNLKRKDLIAKYKLFRAEMRTRNISMLKDTSLDKLLFKRALMGINVAIFKDITVIPDFVSIGGLYVKSPEDTDDLDLIVKQDEKERDETFELKLEKAIQEETGKEVQIVYSESGPESSFIPVFDLVLRAKNETKRIAVKKTKNEHECRLLDPGGFQPARFRRVSRESDGKTYDVIMGRLKGSTSMTEQAYRYLADNWSAAEARAHCKGHDGSFKEAEEKKKDKYGKDEENFRKKLTPAQRKECDEETAKIKENKKKKEAKESHEFKAAKFTHPNGHPRCLICGDEQQIGDVCNMPEDWYSKYKWDDEKAWKEERKKLRKDGIIKFQISKPEETEDFIRIPVNPGCEVTATIDIDKEKGITALYCGKIKKIRAYVFAKEKGWTMATAKKWVKEQKEKQDQAINKDIVFKIIKADKKQQIVGGVVYEPDVIDAQGDYASAATIQQAMYQFMEKYAQDPARVKIMHKGKIHIFPIMESFQSKQDMQVGRETVKAGSWWLMIKIKDKEIWERVEKGELTGFSMGGRASA